MLSRTPRAAVWVAPSPATVAEPAVSPKPADRVLWSERPFVVSSGLCLGVQLLRNGTLMVAFRPKASPTRLDWVSASQVLSAVEADRWAQMRFASR